MLGRGVSARVCRGGANASSVRVTGWQRRGGWALAEGVALAPRPWGVQLVAGFPRPQLGVARTSPGQGRLPVGSAETGGEGVVGADADPWRPGL